MGFSWSTPLSMKWESAQKDYVFDLDRFQEIKNGTDALQLATEQYAGLCRCRRHGRLEGARLL